MIGLPGRRNNKWKVYEFRTGVWEMEWEYLLIEMAKAWKLNQIIIEKFFHFPCLAMVMNVFCKKPRYGICIPLVLVCHCLANKEMTL